jgi:hypothetical protein
MTFLLVLALAAGLAQAQVPQLLSYQGKLLDDTGAPVPDGPYAMEFRFYDDCIGGNLLLTDTHVAVQTRDGIYAVLLGGGTLTSGLEPDLLSVFENHGLVCLGVTVEDDVEMTPRQQIVSAGFALRSAVTDGASAGSGVVESGDDVTWSGVHQFDETVVLADGQSLSWPHVSGAPPQSNFRITKFNSMPPGQETHPDGEADEQWMICYNCSEGSTFREDTTQHSWNQKIEATYWDGVTESLEYNWNYNSPVGKKWRPFAFRLFVDGLCSNDASFCVDDADCGAGNTCDGANRASFSWNTRPDNTNADFELVRSTGRVRFARGLEGFVTQQGMIGGTSSLAGFQLFSTIDTENTASGLVVYAIALENEFASSTENAQLSDMIGVRSKNLFSGSASGRDVTGNMIAVEAWNSVEQTGAGAPGITRVVGYRYRFDPVGNSLTVNESNGVRIETPSAQAVSDPVAIERHVGVRILDQRGLGTVEGDALVINSQSLNPDPERGNLNLKGGGWEDGHLRLENGHLWMDKSSNVMRFKNGAPTAESDGAPLHSPQGTSTGWGGVYWGASGFADFDSGDEVCALAGLTCKETYDMGSTTPLACDASSHATPSFLALCY